MNQHIKESIKNESTHTKINFKWINTYKNQLQMNQHIQESIKNGQVTHASSCIDINCIKMWLKPKGKFEMNNMLSWLMVDPGVFYLNEHVFLQISADKMCEKYVSKHSWQQWFFTRFTYHW